MDDVINNVFRGVRRLDVVETGRRRRWTDMAKQRIVSEAFERRPRFLSDAYPLA
jgi:transposase